MGGFPVPDDLMRDLRKLGLADKPKSNRSYLSDYESDEDRHSKAVQRPRGTGGVGWSDRRVA
jgi:hypothetical protein